MGPLIERFGVTGAGLLILAGGLTELLPFLGVQEKLAHGAVWAGAGLAILIFGKKFKKTTDLYVAREAEKTIANPTVENTSSVPAIQREIEKQVKS